MDFFEIKTKKPRTLVLQVYPSFNVFETSDLIVKGHEFIAVWDEWKNEWSRDVYRVCELVDKEVKMYADDARTGFEGDVIPMYMRSYDSGMWDKFNTYLKNLPTDTRLLDDKVRFSNDILSKEDLSTKHVDYPLVEGPYDAWDELVSTLYDNLERQKIEWAIGSIVAGEAIDIQKFLVFYGEGGTGKSTILNIIQMLFQDYCTIFDARSLTSNSNQFATAAFKDNPLVVIQHDGDLSRIQDNTILNSIVAHEDILINEKHKAAYKAPAHAMIFLGTNQPVKITDARSGLIRRLIDVSPTGNKIPSARYFQLMNKIKFQLSGIAYHCLTVYKELGKNYFNGYKPLKMMYSTDSFFNFMESVYFNIQAQDGECSLKQAWTWYKNYAAEANIPLNMTMNHFRTELSAYFTTFQAVAVSKGERYRSYFRGFKKELFEYSNSEAARASEKLDIPEWLIFKAVKPQDNRFNKVCFNCKAQYANRNGTPTAKWDDVSTILADISTDRLHYVLLPDTHIVVDFDLKDENGEKCLEKNQKAAASWPPTYAEVSKSGQGIHLHYLYTGDPIKLSRIFDTGIEIKVFNGNSSLRRKLTVCNDLPIARISSGLPLREVRPVVNFDALLNEKQIRRLIERNLRKEIHANTKPSVEFIYTILEEQNEKGAIYDVRDMAPDIMTFASRSTHNPKYCMGVVAKMKFKSDTQTETDIQPENNALTFFDVEVFPNLLLINWKYEGEDKKVVRMINPTPQEVEKLMEHKLVGFNCIHYDAHILYARYLGWDNQQIYNLSQRIIKDKKKRSEFTEALNMCYADCYDFASAGNKKSLKKWEVELGIHHQELGLPWDEPVPEDQWPKVAEYCDNDVISTEIVFHHLSGDWLTRQMLAELSGLPIYKSTNQHTYQILFGNNKHPGLVYTDLVTGKQYGPGEEVPYGPLDRKPGYSREVVDPFNAFPDYNFVGGANLFRGEDIGRGGYVYAVPGMYSDVVCFDSASHHPSSIIAMNYLGEFTPLFKEILDVRIAIKHKDFEAAKKMMGGRLARYLEDESQADAVSSALKTVVNSLYGTSAARFDNPARDPRNVNNIVALRGALFMVTLRDELEAKGAQVIHIKTDSIKVVNPTPDISQFIYDFGKQYGYTFEVEHKFDKICLVNDAVYIGKLSADDPKHPGQWEAVGAQFAQPYVYKTLFSGEPVEFKDMCEIKSVNGGDIYIDRSKGKEHDDMVFVGRTGLFTPMKPGTGGGKLVVKREDKISAVTGTKGYEWMESEVVQGLHKEEDVDESYYRKLVFDAASTILDYGDIYGFLGVQDGRIPPWCDETWHCNTCEYLNDCSVALF